MEAEIWKDIIGYKGLYQISNVGNIRSVDRYVKQRKLKSGKKQLKIGKTIKQQLSNVGYFRVQLNNEFTEKKHTVHRLIAKSFIPNPENKPCVNHINGIKTDNRIENLEWCTRTENQNHAYKIGLQKRCFGTERGRVSKLKNEDIKKIRNMILSGASQKIIAKKFKVDQSNISCIKNGKTWAHV